MPSADRHCVAQIPQEALDAWKAFVNSHSPPLFRSALAEVIGFWIIEHQDDPLVTQWVEETKRIMAERYPG